ncbi:MAG: tol-pal system YbgF family protein [Opitutales bacterium]
MPRIAVFPCLAALGLALVTGLQAAEPSLRGLQSVWSLAASSQPVEARTALNRLDGLDARTRALAQAVLDLARPPLSGSDWNRVEPVLAELAQGNDEIAARALYLQARMYQVQKTPPDYARAGQLYRELTRRWPGSHWAQLGLVKLGLVMLYASPEPADARIRLAQVTALLDQVAEPTLRRDLELQIGWAGIFYEQPLDEVLPHLIAADRVGGLMGITPEDLVTQIGELSFRAGHLAQARSYFERFLREFPTNTRKFNVEQRLKQVIAAQAEAKS